MNTTGIEEDIARRMAEQMAEQIDWEILCDLLVEMGWHKIVFDMNRVIFSIMELSELKKWCQENIKSNYKSREEIWLFEHSQDAELFSLRWL